MAILPLHTPSTSSYIVAECIPLYRPNCFFPSFTITSTSDLTLIYGILFIQECLNGLREGMGEREARHLLNMHATERCGVMGEDGFGVLSSVFPAARSSKESGKWC